jgi:AcrR family transcriptional regulator
MTLATETPRERRRARNRRHILSAARDLVEESGPLGLSLREVARRSDYSPAALYEYFDSKEELMAALLSEGFEELTELLDATATQSPPAERLIEMAKAYVRFAIDHPDLIELIFVRSQSTASSLEGVLSDRNHYTILREQALQLIGEQADETLVDARTYALWAQVHGLALLRISFLKNFDADLDAADAAAITRSVRALTDPPISPPTGAPSTERNRS